MTAAWPLFRLRVVTARLELRPLRDADLDELLALARAGIHDPGEMPFLVPWTDTPAAELPSAFCRYFWEQRASWTPASWRLPLVVRLRLAPEEGDSRGPALGVQQLQADRFAELGCVDTSSWLGARHQGTGIGTEMRAAALELAFRGLGAQVARSTALAGNAGSIRISEKLGYRPNGDELAHVRGRRVRNLRFALEREAWLAGTGRTPCATVTGLAGLEPLFGAAPPGGAPDEAPTGAWFAAAGLR